MDLKAFDPSVQFLCAHFLWAITMMDTSSIDIDPSNIGPFADPFPGKILALKNEMHDLMYECTSQCSSCNLLTRFSPVFEQYDLDGGSRFLLILGTC